MKDKKDTDLSRRGFLGAAALLGVGAAGAALAACSPNDPATSNGSGTAPAEEAGVIVIGSGMAGMCAALKLVDLGVDTLIVDKGESLNLSANSIISSGMFCFPLDESQQSKDLLASLFNAKSNGEGNAAFEKIIADGVLEGMDWIRSHGGEFTDAVEAPTGDHRQCFAAPGASQGMGPLLQSMAGAYTAAGGKELCGAKVIDFIFNDKGAVAGVKVRTADGYREVRAKATIIAAGGYVANRQLLETFVGPEADEMMMRGNKANTGDVILAAVRAGSMLVQMGGVTSLHVGAVAPDNTAAGNPYLALPFTVAVNSLGERYTDESLGYVNNGKAVMEQPGQVCALIFDDAIAEVANVKTDVEKFERLGIAMPQASSLADLAAQIGVPADTLQATIAAFNAASDGTKTSGLAVEKTNFAMKIEGPTYYAFSPLKPGSMMGFGGVYTDENMNVLEADGTPIENLYIAGECIGGVYKHDYLSGASLARCVSTGIKAAENAARKID
jgi:succinate dehydrogenase/fumarate reductase flavoprotein subunit